MRIRILYEIPGRIRFATELGRLNDADADLLEYYLRSLPDIGHAKVYTRSGNVVVNYNGSRSAVLSHITAFSLKEEAKKCAGTVYVPCFK